MRWQVIHPKAELGYEYKIYLVWTSNPLLEGKNKTKMELMTFQSDKMGMG